MPAMMLQSGNRERTRIRPAIKQKWLALTEMSDTRAANLFREMPPGANAVSHQLSFSMMSPDIL
jgi:hypothetical protein